MDDTLGPALTLMIFNTSLFSPWHCISPLILHIYIVDNNTVHQLVTQWGPPLLKRINIDPMHNPWITILVPGDKTQSWSEWMSFTVVALHVGHQLREYLFKILWAASIMVITGHSCDPPSPGLTQSEQFREIEKCVTAQRGVTQRVRGRKGANNLGQELLRGY